MLIGQTKYVFPVEFINIPIFVQMGTSHALASTKIKVSFSV